MARKRMIDPEYWLDEELATVSPHARLLYIGLWSICDDNYATLPNRPDWIKVQVFPYESVSTPLLLGELSGIGKILLFEVDGKEYWYIKNFFKFQRVEKPSKPKYPEFSEAKSVTSRGGVGEESGRAPAEEKRREEKLREENIYNTEKAILLKKETRGKHKYVEGEVTEDHINQIVQKYNVSVGFVKLQLENLINYTQSTGKTYSDYTAALRGFVLRDMTKRVDQKMVNDTKGAIDARNL